VYTSNYHDNPIKGGSIPLQMKAAKGIHDLRFPCANHWLKNRLRVNHEGQASPSMFHSGSKFVEMFKRACIGLRTQHKVNKNAPAFFFTDVTNTEKFSCNFITEYLACLAEISNNERWVQLRKASDLFCMEIERSVLMTGAGNVYMLYMLVVNAVALMDAKDEKNKDLKTSLIGHLMFESMLVASRQAKNQYDHVIGTVLAPAKKGEPIDILIR